MFFQSQSISLMPIRNTLCLSFPRVDIYLGRAYIYDADYEYEWKADAGFVSLGLMNARFKDDNSPSVDLVMVLNATIFIGSASVHYAASVMHVCGWAQTEILYAIIVHSYSSITR